MKARLASPHDRDRSGRRVLLRKWLFPDSLAQIHRLIQILLLASVGLGRCLITRKASDARRQGATTEAYGAIRRKEERAPARLGRVGNAAEPVPANAGLMP